MTKHEDLLFSKLPALHETVKLSKNFDHSFVHEDMYYNKCKSKHCRY